MQLTRGLVLAAHNGQDKQPQFSQPVLQILSIKKFDSPPPNPERYRLLVSDGDHMMQSMLTTQLNGLCTTNAIVRNTIIRVNKFIINSVQGKKIMIIVECDVLTMGDANVPKIGNPVGVGEAPTSSNTGQVSSAMNPEVAQPQPMAAFNNTNQPRQISQQMPTSLPSNYSNQFNYNTTPARNTAQTNPNFSPPQSVSQIASLSPYNAKWTILVRVISKSDIRTWAKDKSQGRLFSVVFADESGEIKATAFNDGVNAWHDYLVVGQVYYVSKAGIKPAKKQYSKVNNDYEMTLEPTTNIVLCTDSAAAPQIKYNRVPLETLGSLDKDASVDVIVVAHQISDVMTFTSKTTHREMVKREMVVVDESMYQCKLTLWGKEAQDFHLTDSPVLAIKNARVGDYGGRNLSASGGSSLAANPDMKEAHMLKGWYNNYTSQGGQFNSFENASLTGTQTAKKDVFKFVSQVKEEHLGGGDKPDYFVMKASVAFVKNDNLYYPACPSEGCNKKVVEESGGWRCERCNQSFPRPEYRYIISMGVMDHTGQLWLQAFNEIGVLMFGMTGNQLKELEDYNKDEFQKVINKVLFTDANFKVRAKSELYNDESKVRCSVISYEKMDYDKEALELVEKIEGYRGM